MVMNKINWKVRFKNKVWLTSFISLIVGFIFNLLKCFDIAPKVTQNMVMEIVGQFLTFLGLFGVIVDPTTAGLNDSDRAMNYEEPWDDTKIDKDPNGQTES
jgi:phi LC3 family holin